MEKKNITKNTHDAIIEAAFKQADQNGDGRISFEEIIQIFKENNINMNEDDLRARFSICDTDKSGDLDREEYEEFYAKTKIQNSITETKVNHEMVPGSASSKKSKSASNVQEPRTVSDMNKTEIAFSLYDDNRDGYVTSQEMMKRSKALTKAQVDKVFQKFDLDGDGRLSFNEFKKMMIKHQANA